MPSISNDGRQIASYRLLAIVGPLILGKIPLPLPCRDRTYRIVRCRIFNGVRNEKKKKVDRSS